MKTNKSFTLTRSFETNFNNFTGGGTAILDSDLDEGFFNGGGTILGDITSIIGSGAAITQEAFKTKAAKEQTKATKEQTKALREQANLQKQLTTGQLASKSLDAKTLSEKAKENRKTIMLVGGGVLLLTIIGVVSYKFLKK